MSSIIPTKPDVKLPRKQTAQALTAAGYRTAEATLATKASRGGGPPYQLFGRLALYCWGDALAWAQSRLSAPRRNTSEGDAIGQAARTESARSSSATKMKPSERSETTARRRARRRNRAETEVTA